MWLVKSIYGLSSWLRGCVSKRQPWSISIVYHQHPLLVSGPCLASADRRLAIFCTENVPLLLPPRVEASKHEQECSQGRDHERHSRYPVTHTGRSERKFALARCCGGSACLCQCGGHLRGIPADGRWVCRRHSCSTWCLHPA